MIKFSRRIQNLVADFRGLPHDYSISILREEQSIGQLSLDILKKYVKTFDTQINAKIFEHWSLIVGNTFCKLCSPHKISAKGELIIKIQNSIVRQELFFRKDEILKRICHLCPESRIDKIVFSL